MKIDIKKALEQLSNGADDLARERDEAELRADRVEEQNQVLCDDLAALGERMGALEAALIRVASWGGPAGTFARAALLDMDEHDEGLEEAWRQSRFATARAA